MGQRCPDNAIDDQQVDAIKAQLALVLPMMSRHQMLELADFIYEASRERRLSNHDLLTYVDLHI